jgi:hypothetical protein
VPVGTPTGHSFRIGSRKRTALQRYKFLQWAYLVSDIIARSPAIAPIPSATNPILEADGPHLGTFWNRFELGRPASGFCMSNPLQGGRRQQETLFHEQAALCSFWVTELAHMHSAVLQYLTWEWSCIWSACKRKHAKCCKLKLTSNSRLDRIYSVSSC